MKLETFYKRIMIVVIKISEVSLPDVPIIDVMRKEGGIVS